MPGVLGPLSGAEELGELALLVPLQGPAAVPGLGVGSGAHRVRALAAAGVCGGDVPGAGSVGCRAAGQAHGLSLRGPWLRSHHQV